MPGDSQRGCVGGGEDMAENQGLYRRCVQARLPRYRELPALELYKDQVVELVNQGLAPFFPGEAALTDTMVNNYVKLRVIAPPVRKRYDRQQLAQLMQVCLLKRVLSIAQLRQLLELQRTGGTVEHSYDDFCALLEGTLRNLLPRGEQEERREEGLTRQAVSALACKLAFEDLLSRQD